MMTVLLLAALGVSALGVAVNRRWRLAGQAMMILGGLGLVGVLALQFRQSVFTPHPKPPSRCAIAVSTCLADCMMRDLSSRSGTVVLLFPERRVMDADTEQSYEQGFTLPLRHGRGDLHLKAIHLEAAKDKGGHSVAEFRQALVQAPDALAIICYAGVPAGFETLFAGQANPAPFYAFDPEGGMNWVIALKQGHLRAVVLPRPGVNTRDLEGATGTPQDIFDRFYLLATPSNADEVAAQFRKSSR